jgi:hypothetical protein
MLSVLGSEVCKYPRTLFAFLLSFHTNDRCVLYCVMFCAQLIVVLGGETKVI